MFAKIIDDVLSRTDMKDRQFITVMVLFKMAQIATNMRARITYIDGTQVPMNFYGLALATSGANKNRTLNYLERYFKGFERLFMSEYAPTRSKMNLDLLRDRMATSRGIDESEAEAEIMREWRRLPKHLYSFSDATIEGAKAFRQKLTMAKIGSLNLQVDEIASNLDRISDVLTLFLETYDMGYAKQKLIKIDSNGNAGQVDSNMLLFGTPSRLLNGSAIENQFFELLEEGYGRRLIYAYSDENTANNMTVEEAYEILTKSATAEEVDEISEYIKSLCTDPMYQFNVSIDEPIGKKLLEYKIECERKAAELPSIKVVQKAEMAHRYWRALKIAGILSFFNKEQHLSDTSLAQAIKVCEESGKSFEKMMQRPPNYKRLFEYLVDVNKKVTQTELVEQLFFYNKASKQAKDEMLTMAKAYAYNDGGVIRETFKDGVQFISAEKLKETSSDELIVSYSSEMAHNFEPIRVKWTKIPDLLKSGLEWCPRHFIDKHRNLDNVLPEFNLLVLDIDDGVSMKFAMEVMKDYKFIVAHTKNHQKKKNGIVCDRFRMVFMLDRELSMKNQDYTQFMKNVQEWLPFEIDSACFEASRKYSTVKDGEVFVNEGEPINAIDFIPDTTRSENIKREMKDIGDVTSLQRWFLLRASEGNRNNMLVRLAFMLLDNGGEYEDVEEVVLDTNNRLDNPLPANEIVQTIMRTARRRLRERDEQ